MLISRLENSVTADGEPPAESSPANTQAVDPFPAPTSSGANQLPAATEGQEEDIIGLTNSDSDYEFGEGLDWERINRYSVL